MFAFSWRNFLQKRTWFETMCVEPHTTLSEFVADRLVLRISCIQARWIRGKFSEFNDWFFLLNGQEQLEARTLETSAMFRKDYKVAKHLAIIRRLHLENLYHSSSCTFSLWSSISSVLINGRIHIATEPAKLANSVLKCMVSSETW